jgi:hypothetical protein
VTIISVFIAGFLLGLLGSYLPRELYVRHVVKRAVGCPCGRPVGVILMTVTRAGAHPVRYVFLRCLYHAPRLEEILKQGLDTSAIDQEMRGISSS